MTRTEQFTYKLCNNTFLSLWSFPNPIGKKGRELCDILIICEPDITIISVKEINVEYKDENSVRRWLKRAIDNSVNQIYGAERHINSVDYVLSKDKKVKIEIPKDRNWVIHRVAVSFGCGGEFPIFSGEFGKGFVHVFDEYSIQIVMHELDTIADFLKYLNRKEEFARRVKNIKCVGEEDIMAFYLSNDCSFTEEEPDSVTFGHGIWEDLKKNESYLDYRKALQVSYTWDKLITTLIDDFQNDNLINKTQREELELTLRDMARENRESRKLLSEQFLEFIGYNSQRTARSRMIVSNACKELVYVFLIGEHADREYRQMELQLRCFVARYLNKDSNRIVGIATEPYNSKGFSLDFCYYYMPELSEEMNEKIPRMMDELDYFKNPVYRKLNN